MRRRTTSPQQPGSPAQQRPGADGEHPPCARRLVADPAEHGLVLHQRFLSGSARDVQHVELGGIRHGCIGSQTQPPDVPHRGRRRAVEAVGRVRDAGQHLERPGQVDLVHALEHQGADRQVRVWLHRRGRLFRVVLTRKMDPAGLACMPKNPRFTPKSVRRSRCWPFRRCRCSTWPGRCRCSRPPTTSAAATARPTRSRSSWQGGAVPSSSGLALVTEPLLGVRRRWTP